MKVRVVNDFAYWKVDDVLDSEKMTEIPIHHFHQWVEENRVEVIKGREDKPEEPETTDEEPETKEGTDSVSKIIEEAKKIYSKEELDKFAGERGINLDRRSSLSKMLETFIKEVEK